MTAWPQERIAATPAHIHERDIDTFERRFVVCEPNGAALVLGSVQPSDDFDLEITRARGLPVIRRRSGGGAVLVEPGRLLWTEVVIPRTDPLWEEDLGRSFVWLGRVWTAALKACGVERAGPYEGPLMHSRWSRRICFAGLGPGEVTVGGRKVVGLSQRRRRGGAVFHMAVLLDWDPDDLVGLVAIPEPERAELSAQLSELAGPVQVPADDLVSAFGRALAQVG